MLLYLAKTNESNDINGDCIFEAQETKSNVGNGNTILFPVGIGKITSILVSLIMGTGGRGKVQVTTSKYEDVVAENGYVNWTDWGAGEVIADETATFYPVVAVRLVNVSGEITIEVRAV